MGRIFEIYCIKVREKVLRLPKHSVEIDQIDVRQRIVDDIYRLIIFT